MDARRYELAAKEFRAVLAAQPQHALAHASLSVCQTELQRFSQAVESAREAVRIDPGASYGHYALSLSVRRGGGTTQEALGTIEEAIRLHPNCSLYWSEKSFILICESRWPEAVAAALHSLSLDPTKVDTILNRAYALTQMGQYEEADRAITRALELQPEYHRAHHFRAILLRQRKMTGTALLHLREGLRLRPTDEMLLELTLKTFTDRFYILGCVVLFFIIAGGLFTCALAERSSIAAVRDSVHHALIVLLILTGSGATSTPLYFVLRWRRDCRWVLNEDQTQAVRYFSLLISVTLAMTALSLILRDWISWRLATCLAILSVALPCSFSAATKVGRRWAVGYSILITALGFLGLTAHDPLNRTPKELLTSLELIGLPLLIGAGACAIVSETAAKEFDAMCRKNKIA
jgi:tetratricopeptide (TPR) repeat protein